MLEVHVTFPSLAEATVIAREAVEQRLAACANVLSPMHSFYWWDGAVQSEDEVAVVFKTAEGGAATLVAFIAGRHSHQVPAIVVHQPLRVHRPYDDWVARETAR